MKIIITSAPGEDMDVMRARHLVSADLYIRMIREFEERFRRYRKDTDDPDIDDVWDMWFEETKELDR